MSQQIAVRLPDELLDRLETLVASGRFETKAEAVRAAIQVMVETELRRETGRRIAAGYRDKPQTDEEVARATEGAVRSIQEEPW
jgi:Arc/MetJ-type ribon-helix-helix transcriptional regulator